MKCRKVLWAAGALLASLVITRPSAANDPTPTPTATFATPVCTPPPAAPLCGSARVNLNWASKRPDLVTVSVSATHCPMPAACAAAPDFVSVTTAPAAFEVVDSACHRFSTTFTTPATNSTGCPGRDSYKATPDKLRLIYGAETTALAFSRVTLAQPGVIPVLTPPLTFRIFDSAGYAIGRTLNTCLTTQTASSYRLKCF